jgi:hypothetical protein
MKTRDVKRLTLSIVSFSSRLAALLQWTLSSAEPLAEMWQSRQSRSRKGEASSGTGDQLCEEKIGGMEAGHVVDARGGVAV